ncbi:MAG: protein kinase, partial [Dehalococcoidia bacterium]|nr:protein kinase [Dehalococcoidia bacterium]
MAIESIQWSKRPRLAAGQSFGPFSIEAVIGGGRSSFVYRVAGPHRNEHMALKVLRAELCGVDDWGERFLAAAERLKAVDHPGVVKVHEVGIEAGRPYLVEDYLGERNLLFVAFNEGLGFDEAVKIFAELCAAAAHLHSLDPPLLLGGIGPRDVFLRKGLPPCLTDASLLRDSRLVATTLDEDGSARPIECMAPEQVVGGPPSPEGDVYILGLMLLRMIRPTMVWRSIVKQLMRGKPATEFLRSARRNAFDDVLTFCLEPNPGERFPSAVAVLDAMKLYLDKKDVPKPEPHEAAPAADLDEAAKVAVMADELAAVQAEVEGEPVTPVPLRPEEAAPVAEPAPEPAPEEHEEEILEAEIFEAEVLDEGEYGEAEPELPEPVEVPVEVEAAPEPVEEPVVAEAPAEPELPEPAEAPVELEAAPEPVEEPVVAEAPAEPEPELPEPAEVPVELEAAPEPVEEPVVAEAPAEPEPELP